MGRYFYNLTFYFVTLSFSISHAFAQTDERIAQGDLVLGKSESQANRCQECHGVNGMSIGEKIPHHAGQYALYLTKQLLDFQSGARKHEVMTVMAEDLLPVEIANIGSYFASQKTMQGEGESKRSIGHDLFLNGDANRKIPACVSCHGKNGKGRMADNIVYPVIGGQRKIYLRTQLINWKLGERKNSPAGVMNTIAAALSDDEIEALANYLSTL
jgi:cytochrome c553